MLVLVVLLQPSTIILPTLLLPSLVGVAAVVLVQQLLSVAPEGVHLARIRRRHPQLAALGELAARQAQGLVAGAPLCLPEGHLVAPVVPVQRH